MANKEAKVQITLVKSTIGCTEKQIASAAALGLKKIRDSKEHEATPAILGMIKKVDYMVKVEEL